MEDVEMMSPVKPRRSKNVRSVKTPSSKAIFSVKKKVPNVEYSLRNSSTRDLLVNSPSTPKRRPLKEKSLTPSTPTNGDRHHHGINIHDYQDHFDEEENFIMRTPPPSAHMKTPPCRPSKRRARILRMFQGEPGKSVDIANLAAAACEESPSTTLAKVLEDCCIVFKPGKTAEGRTPPRTPRSSRRIAPKVSRLLHRVKSKISK